MKHFLFALLLVGCSSAPVQPVAPQEDPVPVIVARGTDGLVDWTCTVEGLNENLVWVPCRFHNRNPATISSCIRVRFYDEQSMRQVVESRKVCSGVLRPNDNGTNYAAFIKENRRALQKCGKSLNLCVMLAGRAG